MSRMADVRSDAVGPHLPNLRSPYFSEQHEMLRAQVRRFVETEIKPNGAAWEEEGFVPREVLRRMGSAGIFRHPLSGALWRLRDGYARQRGARRRTGAIDVLGRRDHGAGPYRHGLGPSLRFRQRGAEETDGCREIIAGEVDRCRRGDRAGRRLRREGHPHHRAARWRQLHSQRRQDVHHQRRPRRSLLRRREDRPDARRRAARCRCFWSRRARPDFGVGRALDKHGWRSSDTAELHVRRLPHPG